MAHERRPILVVGVLWLAAALAGAGQGVWTRSFPPAEIRAVTADASAGVVYATTGTAVFVSVDGGGSWTMAFDGLPNVTSLLADPGHASSLFAGTDAGVFRSTDRGAHFSPTMLGAPVRAMSADATGTLLLAATEQESHAIMRSTNGGVTWPERDSTIQPVAALLIHPTRSELAYASLEEDPYRPAMLMRSTDGGQYWDLTPLGSLSTITGLVAEWNTRTLYGAREDPDGRIAVSRDGGVTWTASSKGLGARVTCLAVDPVSRRLYAGSDLGVFFSDTHGADWTPMNQGLTDTRVTSIAIERMGGHIHLGTRSGVFDFVVDPPQPSHPCTEDWEHLCLLGGRFRASLTAINPATAVVGRGAANAEGDRFGFFALPTFTGDDAFPEVVVKMLDQTALAGHGFWLFYSGLTSLPYVLEVEDTTTGEIRAYGNSELDPFCGGADTQLFPVDAAAASPSTAASLPPAGTGESLLLRYRLEVTLTVRDPAGNRVMSGTAIPWGRVAGYFSLPELTGDATFPEVVVKMSDGPLSSDGIFPFYWFFQTALTHLPYTLTVTDRLTGISKEYESRGPFCGEADTHTFYEPGF